MERIKDRIAVMISSTVADLKKERDAVEAAIAHHGFLPMRSESVGARSAPPRRMCQEMAKECDLFVLIIGERYGYEIPDLGISVTQMEYEVAKSQTPEKILVYIKNCRQRETRTTRFIELLSDFTKGYFRQNFDSAEQLGTFVVKDIQAWMNRQIREGRMRNISSVVREKVFELEPRLYQEIDRFRSAVEHNEGDEESIVEKRMARHWVEETLIHIGFALETQEEYQFYSKKFEQVGFRGLKQAWDLNRRCFDVGYQAKTQMEVLQRIEAFVAEGYKSEGSFFKYDAGTGVEVFTPLILRGWDQKVRDMNQEKELVQVFGQLEPGDRWFYPPL